MESVAKTFLYDGVKIKYDEIGSGEPIILLHGFGVSSYSWRNIYFYNLVPASGSSITLGWWQHNDGALAPTYITDDLLIGGVATSTAKFQVFGTTGNATTSGNLTFNSAGIIQTTNNQTLTLGGNTTGNIVLAPGNTTVATFTTTGLNMNNLPILNIGNAGTDFIA